MFQRSVKLPQKDSFFLFGARGCGKSTLLRVTFPNALTFDLLDPRVEADLALHSGSFTARLEASPDKHCPVVIDEIQKAPRLLDEVHRAMEGSFAGRQFILTGSSARKLKAGGANLLAGRAVVRNLFPFTSLELGADFRLDDALTWGTLPRIWTAADADGKRDRLDAYASTYLKEEVWGEQLVRKLDPFRRFFEVAAQSNGKCVNASAVARDVGADAKTVQSYFQILEETLLGFHLDAYQTSLRKRLRQAPKFYFFDTGVSRALSRHLTLALREKTSAYGDAFECFLINEIYRRIQYERLDYRMCYLQTPAGVEVDLVLERPGKPLALIEIKSTDAIREDHVAALAQLAKDFGGAEAFCLSRDPHPKKFGNVLALPWAQGLLDL